VSSSVHHGTDFFFVDLSVGNFFGNEVSQADFTDWGIASDCY
jgi:hypothetical protein